MKNCYKKISSILIVCLMTTFLFSCGVKTNNVLSEAKSSNESNSSKTKVETNTISPILNEDWFKNGIHSIRNQLTNTYMLVKGNGEIIVKTIEPELESVGLVRDVDSNTINYVYKTYMGESIVKSTFSGIDYEYTDMNPSSRCRVYDRDGNDIGFEALIYSPSYSSKTKIIYSNRSEDTYSNLHIYDVNTKEYFDANYCEVDVMNGKFIFSTSPYNYKEEREEFVVLDGDLNEIKKVEGYSLDYVVKDDDVEYGILRKRITNDENASNNFKYNFMNSNFEFIFEEDVDENIWNSDRSLLTLRVGDKVFDYDLKKKAKLGVERPYKIEEDTKQLEKMQKEKLYEPIMNKIKDENNIGDEIKYGSTELLLYKDKELILANVYSSEYTENDPTDVYSVEGEKLASFDDLSTMFSDQGYLVVNNDTIYDFDMKKVMTLKNKRNMHKYEHFGKIFYVDDIDLNYELVKPYTVFNENFEQIFENVEDAEFDTYDDYIVIVDKDGTKIVDKDLNVLKTINRKLEIKDWYENKTNYREFTDLDTKRMGLIDNNYNYQIDNLNNIGYKEEKYFNYQNGFEYGLMDYEGRPILKYSIFDSMMEDTKLSDLKGNFIEY